jgi:hypothetical protein
MSYCSFNGYDISEDLINNKKLEYNKKPNLYLVLYASDVETIEISYIVQKFFNELDERTM